MSAAVSAAEFAALLGTVAPSADPLCTRCGKPLEASRALIAGTHARCEPGLIAEARAVVLPPPPTVADLRVALVGYYQSMPRSMQTAIGPSEIAVPCDRRLAYRLRGTVAQPDGRVPWAPMVGTAVHAMVAESLAVENVRLGRERWLVEEKVHPADDVTGSCDAFDVDTGTVIDWKVVGPTSLKRYAKDGPGQQYEGQIQMYGLGWERRGQRPQWVRIVFLPRSATIDDTFEWTAPYRPELAEKALMRMRLLRGSAEAVETIAASPSRLCAWCPFYRKGVPADAHGCPGDVSDDLAREARATAGLIPA